MGVVLIVIGAGVIGDVAWQLWGTGWQQEHSQAALRAELAHQMAGKQASSDSPVLHSATAPAQVGEPTTGSPIGILTIKSIGLSQVIVEGTGVAELQKGPGHYPNTPMPGQIGNVAIAGHRTTYGHPFYSLDALVPGNLISITTPGGEYTYSVTGSRVVAPSDVSVLAATSDATLTLTTCTPRYSATSRLVVSARLVGSQKR
jgi:sortase A